MSGLYSGCGKEAPKTEDAVGSNSSPEILKDDPDVDQPESTPKVSFDQNFDYLQYDGMEVFARGYISTMSCIATTTAKLGQTDTSILMNCST
jgi:hypothetical protein